MLALASAHRRDALVGTDCIVAVDGTSPYTEKLGDWENFQPVVRVLLVVTFPV